MNKIFELLTKNSIEKCVQDFNNLSKEVFVDKEGKLVHPGEYGTYRERIIRKLIKQFIPERYDIGTGFIITSKGNTSTQCDLIIFDKENTPVLENDNQRFFPIESVAGVIEVKSILSKENFKNSLIKLCNVKKMRDDVGNAPYIYKDKNENLPFDTKKNVRDQIATFLICERLSFNPKDTIDNVFRESYDSIDKSLYHNMILSLNDGCFLYFDDSGHHFYHPYVDYEKERYLNSFVFPSEIGYKYEHVLLFVNYFFMCISSVSIFFVEITNYIGSVRLKRSILEKK